MLRFVSATALCLLLIGAGTVPAAAHADFVGSNPASGSVVKRPPTEITLRFSESVQVNAVKVLDGNATEIPSRNIATGNRVSVIPARTLPKGAYAVTWSVVSEDGHTVNGAAAFGVRIVPERGPSVPVVTMPSSDMTLSSSRPGRLILKYSQRVTGELEWMHPALLGPVTWGFDGRTASGVLPFAGTWALSADVLRGSALIVYRGRVDLS